MSTLYIVLGSVLLFVIIIDLVKTTFTSTGGGLITKTLSRGVWILFFWAARKNGRSKLLPYAGSLTMLAVLLIWVLGLWTSFFLLLLSDYDSVMNSSTKAPADTFEKLYYAAFTLSSLGVGDFTATSDFWRIMTGVAAFSGLVFITASITYFVPVLSAVGQQSKFCTYLHSMGKTPQEILINSWNGSDFSLFFDKSSDLIQMLLEHSLNHHAYPVIHYFHSSKPELSVAPTVVLLNETLQLLRSVVSKEVVTDPLSVTMLQTAIDQYLHVVKSNFLTIDSNEDEMPEPDLHALVEKGIPLREGTVRDDDTLKPFLDRRKILTNLLAKDGWTWRDVYGL